MHVSAVASVSEGSSRAGAWARPAAPAAPAAVAACASTAVTCARQLQAVQQLLANAPRAADR
jgi:hypothetical protein